VNPFRWRSAAAAALLVSALAVAAAGPAPLAGRPVLELLEPEVDQATLRLAVRARNRGQAALPSSTVTVRYRVEGVVRGPAQLIADGTFLAVGVSVPAGGTAALGGVVLPDRRRALSFEHVTVNLALVVAGPIVVEPTSASFPLRWWTRTVVLDTRALRAAGSGRVRIRLNGFDPAIGPAPVAREECFVALSTVAGEAALRFGLPPGTSAPAADGAAWLVLVNATGGESPAGEAFSVRDGRLLLRLVVAGRSTDGLKVGAVAHGRFDDAALPDLPLAPFPVSATLALAVDRDRAALCVVGAAAEAATVPPDLPAAMSRLGPAARGAIEAMRGSVTQALTALLARADARSLVEQLLARAVAANGPVSAVYAVEGRGDTIVVTCI